MYCDSYWTSYKIISLGPTMSMETPSQKKAFFHHEKQFCSFFTHISEYGRPQVDFFQAPQGFMAIDVQVIRSFL